MGANHARVIHASPGASLKVVVDVVAERARRLAVEFGARWSSDPSALAECAAAVVATTAETHLQVAASLLEAGIPTLVEKPMATSSADTASLISLSCSGQVPLMPGFVERFNPVVMTLRQHLEVHGPLLHLVAVRHSPPNPAIETSVIEDLLIHDIDLALWLAGTPGVASVGGSLWSPGAGSVPEIADTTLVLQSGALATLSASRMDQRKIRELRVTTPTVLFEADLLRRTLTVYRHVAQGATLDRSGYQAQTVIDIPFVRQEGEPLALQLEAFLRLARGIDRPDLWLSGVEAVHEIAQRVGRFSFSAA